MQDKNYLNCWSPFGVKFILLLWLNNGLFTYQCPIWTIPAIQIFFIHPKLVATHARLFLSIKYWEKSFSGQSLYEFSRGIDTRAINLAQDRKSVSAEVNYGIRFEQEEDAKKFLSQLSTEVRFYPFLRFSEHFAVTLPPKDRLLRMMIDF